MTLLSVIKDVCANVGVQLPTSVFSGITGNRTMQEMLQLASETAQTIAYDTRDWTRLKTTVTYPGDGVVTGGVMHGTTAFDLPANYKRMLLTANVWRSTSSMTPSRFIPDADEWLQRRARNWNEQPYGEWTMMGGKIHIWPMMPVGQSSYFAYLDKNCISLDSGGTGDIFLNDLDTFLLDERLLRLGMIWKWKSNKGAAYAEDMGSYETALGMVSGHDSPGGIIVGRNTLSSSVRVAYPYPVVP
jgi:hypothetical protein